MCSCEKFPSTLHSDIFIFLLNETIKGIELSNNLPRKSTQNSAHMLSESKSCQKLIAEDVNTAYKETDSKFRQKLI